MTAITDPDEWHAWRRGGIGGSDIAGLLGLSRWSTPFTIWCEKVGLDAGQREDNERMRMGRRMESVLAAEFTERTKLYVVGEQECVEAPLYPHHRATLDGRFAETPDAALDETFGPWEAKSFDILDRDGNLKLDVRAQVLWQMWVTVSSQAWVTGLGPFLRVQHHHVVMDDEAWADIEYMRDVAEIFWTKNVLGGVQPEVDGSDATARMIAYLYPVQEPGKRAPLDHIADLIARREEVQALAASVAKLAEAKDALDNRIKIEMGDAEIGTVDGEPVFSLRVQERKEHTVAASTFRVLRPTTKRDKE